MKRTGFHLLIFLSILVITFAATFSAENSASRGKNQNGLLTPTSTRFNINNISTEFRNDGWTDRISPNGNSGFVFPRRSGKTAIFQSGIVWAAKIFDPLHDTLHVGGATYFSGLQPGKIISPGVAEDPNLPKNRVYRVRPDYATADLTIEAREEGRTQAEVRAQYGLDWTQWPANDGAPFLDRNGNGIYEPANDVPGKFGADQTIWYVCNDQDTVRTLALYGTKPLGLEMQVTVWGYQREGMLGDVLFKQYRLINKSTRTFDSMYVCQWSDPDLGDAGDDFAGCDTSLHATFCYNADDADFMYYPMPAPAVGYQLLNIPMTAAFVFASGYAFGEPPFNRDGAGQWLNLIQGLIPIGGAPFVHPNVPGPTKFWLDGDPISGTGRLDGVISAPGDRRMGACAGPFTMAAGSAKDIVIGQIAASGSDRLSSVTKLKNMRALFGRCLMESYHQCRRSLIHSCRIQLHRKQPCNSLPMVAQLRRNRLKLISFNRTDYQ